MKFYKTGGIDVFWCRSLTSRVDHSGLLVVAKTKHADDFFFISYKFNSLIGTRFGIFRQRMRGTKSLHRLLIEHELVMDLIALRIGFERKY